MRQNRRLPHGVAASAVSRQVRTKSAERIVRAAVREDHICLSKTAAACAGGAVIAQPSQAPMSHSEHEEIAEPFGAADAGIALLFAFQRPRPRATHRERWA